jgi:uncharacterized glyoxalase superfamily protein PhnB
MKLQFDFAPNFIVADLAAAIAYYRDRLSFDLVVSDGDPPNFAIVQGLGGCVMLKSLPGVKGTPNHLMHEDLAWDAYIQVPDVDSVYDDLNRRGANISRPPENAYYGFRDFEVRDLDGYVLCVGKNLNAAS